MRAFWDNFATNGGTIIAAIAGGLIGGLVAFFIARYTINRTLRNQTASFEKQREAESLARRIELAEVDALSAISLTNDYQVATLKGETEVAGDLLFSTMLAGRMVQARLHVSHPDFALAFKSHIDALVNLVLGESKETNLVREGQIAQPVGDTRAQDQAEGEHADAAKALAREVALQATKWFGCSPAERPAAVTELVSRTEKMKALFNAIEESLPKEFRVS